MAFWAIYQGFLSKQPSSGRVNNMADESVDRCSCSLEYVSVSCNRTPLSVDWGRNGLVAYGACRSVALYRPKVRETPSFIIPLHVVDNIWPSHQVKNLNLGEKTQAVSMMQKTRDSPWGERVGNFFCNSHPFFCFI